ncbi:MAG TPA: SAM-dependent chlorinase/fluorinase [Gammaproteobacteria bacterium]|nr:SAM-dependent chlorinase/fluorinase [Gammaproteobacteria bacterium]MCP5436291.1 SAM-dependent chlorinase/fluorinase [Chromatiaceae bacterium]HPQ24900.1 SAM-dependent chlorinase/fluorinase [Gammaproteobacteria bacterium]
MSRPRPIFLFTDFGGSGPYVGQMTAAIYQAEPDSRVINLMHDAPAMRPDLAAYLLPACSRPLDPGSVVVAVVDPGVGGDRAALVVEAAEKTFVGPDNGLLSRLPDIGRVSRVDWRPASLSASFHGRDLFAPVAARLAAGHAVATSVMPADVMVGSDWSVGLARVVYVDAYGNLMVGLDAQAIDEQRSFNVLGRHVVHAGTFCRVPAGQLFWYGNSLGLLEIAANGASAADILSLALGDRILID